MLLLLIVLAGSEPELNKSERVIFNYVNRIREERGLDPLRIDAELQAAARKHCAEMCRSGLRHTRARVFENVASGHRSCNAAVQAWMRSNGHRRNILNPQLEVTGVAAYKAADGTTYYCQQFNTLQPPKPYKYISPRIDQEFKRQVDLVPM